MGMRIMKSFTKYICEKVLGLGLGQKLAMITKIATILNTVWKSKHVVREDEPLM